MEFNNFGDLSNKKVEYSPLLTDMINRQNNLYNPALHSNKSDEINLGNTYTDNVKSLNDELDKIKQEQGLIGKLWDGFKNVTHIGAGSNKVEDAIKQLQNGEIDEKTAREKLEKYKDGQKVCIDVAADMISSIVAVGAFAAAVPTGGMSLAAGLGLSTVIGGSLKVGIKGVDSKLNGREYNSKNILYDAVTGGINGLLAPVTNGLGSSLTKTIGCKLGLEISGDIVSQGAKTTLKSLIVNQSIDVAGETMKKRALALGAGMALDGALGGTSDNVTRAILEGEDAEGVVKSGLQGFIGGLIMSPVIGGGFRVMGKLGNKLGKKIFKNNTPDTDTNTSSSRVKPDDIPDAKPNPTPKSSDSALDIDTTPKGETNTSINTTPETDVSPKPQVDVETNAQVDVQQTGMQADAQTAVQPKSKTNVTVQLIEVQKARMEELTKINSTIQSKYDKFSNEFIEKAAKEFSPEQYSLLLTLKNICDEDKFSSLTGIPQIFDNCSDETAKILNNIAKLSAQIPDDRSFCRMSIFDYQDMCELNNSQLLCLQNILADGTNSHTGGSLINGVKDLNDFQLEVFKEFSHIKSLDDFNQIKPEKLREIALSMPEENFENARNILSLKNTNKYKSEEILEKLSQCTKEEASHLENVYRFLANDEIKERFKYKDVNCVEKLSNEELEIAKRLLLSKNSSGDYIIDGYYDSGLMQREPIIDLFMKNHSKSRYELIEEFIKYKGKADTSNLSSILIFSDKKADFIKRNLYIEGKCESCQLYNMYNLNHLPDDKLDFIEKSGILFIPERGEEQFDALQLARLAEELNETSLERAKRRNLFTMVKGTDDEKHLLYSDEIIDLAKVSDENWQKTFQISNIEKRGKEQFKSEDIVKLASLSDDAFEKAKKYFYIENRNYQFDADDIIKLINLDEKQIDNISKRGLFTNSRYNGFDLSELSSLTDSEFNRITPFMNTNSQSRRYFSGAELKNIATSLTDEELKRAQTLIEIPERCNIRNIVNPATSNQQFNGNEIIKLSKLEPEILENLRYFFGEFGENRYGILDKAEIMKLSNLSSEELQKAKELIVIPERDSFRQFSVDNILNLLKLSDGEFKQAQKLFNVPQRGFQQFDADEICALAKLSPKDLEKAKKYLYIEGLEYQPDGKTISLLAKYEDVHSIDSLSIHKKRELLKDLIKNNSDLFRENSKKAMDFADCQILPSDKNEYCSLLPRLVKSIGISTNELSDDVKKGFYGALASIEAPDSAFRKFDFEKPNLKIDLTYSRAKFVSDMSNILAPLTKEERNIVCNYFGFEIISNKGSYFMNGYPVNLNNGVELAKIDNPKLKNIIETMRPLVKDFSENNSIKIKDEPELSDELNAIIKAFPEFITEIGKKQHKTHDFTLDIHSLKVLQDVVNNPRYNTLSDNDKMTLKIASLLHDITKQENLRDGLHPQESAYDVYYLLQKLNLPEDEKLEIYQIIKDHNWLQKYNVEDTAQRSKIAKDIAFDLRKGSSFEMASILTEADMKAVKRNGTFFKDYEQILEQAKKEIGSHVDEIQKTAIPLPQTKIPRASEIVADGDKVKEVVTKLSSGKEITNKVIYLEPNMDLSKYGFEKGLTSEDLNVLIHTLDNEQQSSIFQALGQIDSDALLSTSYVTYAQQNYHAFRPQGFILDVDADDINAGYHRDFGSGYKKDLDGLKNTYLFKGDNSKYREYISKSLKELLNLDDKEYVKLFNKIKNKSILELDSEYPEVAKAMRELFKKMEGQKRNHGRQYNEMLVTRPRIQAVFDYGKTNDISVIPEFLRQYAAENNLPILYFGK